MNRRSVRFLLTLAFSAAGLAGTQAGRAGMAPGAGRLSGRSIYQLDAAWTGDDGAPFRLVQLLGHPVVIAMIFTRCGSACPRTVEEMKGLEKALPKAIGDQTRFVLVSFDSEGDTPPVLRTYRKHSGLDEKRWILLHGNPEQVRELAMALGVSFSQVGAGLFSHSTLVSVLNRGGEIVFQRPDLQGAGTEAVQAVSGTP